MLGTLQCLSRSSEGDAVKGGPVYIKIDGVDGEFRRRRPGG